MVQIKLASRARKSLREIVRSNSNARQVKRAQALLRSHEGNPVSTVAQDLSLSRRSIQRLVKQYRDRTALPIIERIRESRRSGRPPKQLQLARQVIQRMWPRDPRRYGFRALSWTVPMLRCLIHRRTGKWLGLATVRRALRSLRYRYKRPRLVLARRSATWRQAKGGLNAA